MATIVQHTDTGEKYVLLGAGYGAYQSKKPNVFFGNWVADTDAGEFAMVCVCNAKGLIGWMNSTEVDVISVDGKAVRELIP